MDNSFEHDKKIWNDWTNSEEYQKKLTERLQINDACLRDKDSQFITYQLCAQDPLFFIENFGWTFDPRPQHEPHHLPFLLFDYQKDAIIWIIQHIKEGRDGLIEKSRDMGVTWLLVYSYYWLWKFSESFSGLIGSRKERLVDDRTRTSVFGFLDYALQNTPHWLLPPRFNFNKHRQKLKLINPETFNIISGDTMSPEFGRGQRRSVITYDEGAFWDYFREAWEAGGDSTSCRLAISTPCGRNAFALLRESGIDVLTLHWKKHPLKDDFWYQAQKARRTDEEIAQELDISYHKSQTGRVYPEWDDVQFGLYPYDENLPLYVSWDFGNTDDTALIWYQDEFGKVRIIDAYSNHGKTIDFYVPFITGVAPSDDYKYTKKDFEVIESHKNWKRGIHFGDPAGRFTNQVVNKSVMDVLKDYGIVVNFREEAKDFPTRKTETKLLLRNLVVNDNPRTKEMGLAIENSSYPKITQGGMEDIKSIHPSHNWTSHYRSSLEYFAVNFSKLKARRNRIFDKFPIKQNRERVIGY